MCRLTQLKTLVFVAALGAHLAHAEERSQGAEPGLIDRAALFGAPDRVAPRLSPDGEKIAFLSRETGRYTIWWAPVDDVGSAAPVAGGATEGVRFFYWSQGSDRVLYTKRTEEGVAHVCSAELVDEPPVDLTPFPGASARVVGLSSRRPGEALIAMNTRDPAVFDLYRVDIETGARELSERGDGFSRFVVDGDHRARFALRDDEGGGYTVMRPGEDGGWETFLTIDRGDADATRVVGLGERGRTLYMIDSRGFDTSALVAVDGVSGASVVLADRPWSDVGDLLVHPTRRHMQAASFTALRKRWVAIDATIEADLAFLGSVADGEMEIVSRSADDARWIVRYEDPQLPARHYVYERAERRVRALFRERDALKDAPLARMTPARLRARDGLELGAYLTLPRGADKDRDGRPEAPLALALLVHGGPWTRDAYGWSPTHQFLADRGYAALSVNFRGSSGMGKAFMDAGDREWGAAMQDDLVDAVKWAVAEGIADPQRVAIIGGSYGGYAALMGAARDTGLFACVVSIAGPTDLATLVESVPTEWTRTRALFRRRIGDASSDEGRARLAERSPAALAGRVRAPTLIAQGGSDRRAPRASTEAFVDTLRRGGVEVVYALFEDEGHGLSRRRNQIAFYALMEAFLAKHLGGAAQEVGGAFEGSSIRVPIGAGLIGGVEPPKED